LWCTMSLSWSCLWCTTGMYCETRQAVCLQLSSMFSVHCPSLVRKKKVQCPF
jgi:hypothetical protein